MGPAGGPFRLQQCGATAKPLIKAGSPEKGKKTFEAKD